MSWAPSRRQFLGALLAPAGSAVAAALLPMRAAALAAELESHPGSAQELAADEAFWHHAQTAFTVDRSLVNLNNGGVSPAPATVQAAMKRHLDYSNEAPPFTMWQVLEPQREGVRQRLARAFGCVGRARSTPRPWPATCGSATASWWSPSSTRSSRASGSPPASTPPARRSTASPTPWKRSSATACRRREGRSWKRLDHSAGKPRPSPGRSRRPLPRGRGAPNLTHLWPPKSRPRSRAPWMTRTIRSGFAFGS